MDYKMKKLIPLLMLSVVLSACSDSESGGSVSGLKLPKQINPTGANVNSQVSGSSFAPAAFTDPGTDYSTDPVNHYSSIEAFSDFELVNMFLCFIDKVGATDSVNTGPYNTELPESECSAYQGDTQSVNLPATIESIRASNDSPHIINMWVDFDDPEMNTGDPAGVQASAVLQFTINEGVTDTNLIGAFTLNYKIVEDASLYGGTLGTPIDSFIVRLDVHEGANSFPRIDLIMRSGPNTIENITYASTAQLFDYQANSGQSRSYVLFENGLDIYESEFSSDFDQNHVLAYNVFGQGLDACYSKNDYTDSVFGYNLYYNINGTFQNETVTEGQRVELAEGDYITIPYTHSLINDRNNDASFAGTTTTLSYFGPGQLWGIPWTANTEGVYSKDYDLKDGTVLNDGLFVVKAVDIDHSLVETPGQCQNLDAQAILNDATLDPIVLAEPTKPNIDVSDRPLQ